MTFRRRIALLAGLSFVVAVIACSVVGFATVRRQMLAQIDGDLIRRVGDQPLDQPELAGRGPRRVPGRAGPLDRVRELAGPTDVLFQTVPAAGEIEASAQQVAVIPVADTDLAIASGSRDTPPVLRTDEIDGQRFRVVTAALPRGDAVMIARPLTEVDTTLRQFAGALVLVSIAGSVLAAAVGWWVARRSARPVEALTVAAEHVAETLEFDVGLTPKHDDEIGRLTTSIASMLAALRSSRDQQQRLVMDASHEFRTPLTSLRMIVSMLDHPDLDARARSEVMADIRSELEELSDLSAELVDLATESAPSDPSAPVDMVGLVQRVADRTARRTGHRFVVDTQPWVVWGVEVQLERAVQNLFDNAAKWNADGRPIEVVASAGRLVVRDHGPGIAASERELVFGRFYRSASARATPGSGLGLAIVRQIVTNHGGTVTAGAPDEGSGAVLTVELAAWSGPPHAPADGPLPPPP